VSLQLNALVSRIVASSKVFLTAVIETIIGAEHSSKKFDRRQTYWAGQPNSLTTVLSAGEALESSPVREPWPCHREAYAAIQAWRIPV